MELPDDGDALLAFKRHTVAPPELKWGRGAVALDDPLDRLKELEAFDGVAMDFEGEQTAVEAAGAASVWLRAATTVGPDLQPWHVSMRIILEEEVDEPELPVRLLPELLLGDASVASDVQLLVDSGITHVLNASDVDYASEEYYAADISYLQLNAVDDVTYCMKQHVAAASAFLQRARDEAGVCLCHCTAGINRSGFIAASELMRRERCTVLDAVRRLKRARATTLLNAAFQVQLLQLAQEEGRLGDALDKVADEP